MTAIFVSGVGLAREKPRSPLNPLGFQSERLHEQLAVLGESLATSRIVLLGENGHGVGDFTRAKAKLVEWLYDEHGFQVIVFESGLFECGQAWRRLETSSSKESLLACLRYPFQHRELLPLFDLIRAKRGSNRPLILAGMDIQAQGFDSEGRPEMLHDLLDPIDAELADRLEAIDRKLFLRMGITPMRLVPAQEFDALLYIDRVKPPDFKIP